MAISFPSSPSNGQKFTHGNKVWTWDGNSWKGGVSSGGDAGTLDSLNSTQFLRSDTDTSTTGKLGIGTTSPGSKLEVNGQITAHTSTGSGTYSIGVMEITTSATPSQIKITTNISWSGSTHAETVTIKGFQYGGVSMANIQIGWHKYLNQFWSRNAVSSGSWAPSITLGVENDKVVIHLTAPGYWPKLYVESHYSPYKGASTSIGWSWSDAAISPDANTPQQSVSYKSNFGNNFVMDTGGNVGIGTAGPGEKLHVEGSIRASGNIGVTQTDGDYLAKLYQTSADGFLELYTGEATPVSRVKLSSYGNSYIAPSTNSRLGIGTTNPAGRLHVLGTGGTSSTIQLESSGAGNTVFYMKGANGNDFWGMFTGSTGGGFTLKDETNNKDAFIARPQGKLAYPNQTRFSAFSTSGSTSYSAGSPFILDYVRNNINNRYNTANGIFTADVSGYYTFRFNAYAYTSGQWSVLYWNGSGISYYYDTDGTTSAGDHTVLCTVAANSIHHMAWSMYLASGTGCAVGWRSGYSGSIYRSHAQFSGELISAD